MRLTREVLLESPQFTNPLDERELDLRGRNLQLLDAGALEELGDTFDTIDLSENNIARLDNFPVMQRLTTLIAHRNQISKISKFLGNALPHLRSLVLHQNQVKELVELDALVSFPELERIALVGNEVTRKPYYRLYVIVRCPKLKLLDYTRVSDAEKAAAFQMFPASTVPQRPDGSIDAATARRLRREARRAKATSGGTVPAPIPGVPPNAPVIKTTGGPDRIKETEEDLEKLEVELQERMNDATTLEELDAIEQEIVALQARKAKRQRLE